MTESGSSGVVFDQTQTARRARRLRDRKIRTARATIRVLILGFVCLVFWATRTELPQMAYAEGTIEPHGSLRLVEHLDGGAVADLHAREGDEVRAGDVLMRFDGSEIEAELRRHRTRRRAIDVHLHRLDTALAAIGTDPAGTPVSLPSGADMRTITLIDAHRARQDRLLTRIERSRSVLTAADGLHQTIVERETVFQDRLATARKLSERGVTSRNHLSEMEAERLSLKGERVRAQSSALSAKADLDDAMIALAELHESFRDTLLAERDPLVEEAEMLDQSVEDLLARSGRLSVVSPVDGIVHRLHVASRSDVVVPGGPIAEVLPKTETLIGIVRLRPQDVGHIEAGNRVELKSTAFNPKIYGQIEGRVQRVSPTSTLDTSGHPYFDVRVALDRQTIGKDEISKPLRAGLEINAAIVTGRRTVIDILIDPVLRPVKTAFRER